MKVAVIGGGAAGFFAALSVKEHHPSYQVTIIEKSTKLLSKVKISGGGRCNVTNGTTSISEFAAAYPRGQKQLKKLFKLFSAKDTIQWFEKRNVPLMTQEDNCVFPVSQDSQSIIDCFLKESARLKIQIKTKHSVEQIVPDENTITLNFKQDIEPQSYDKIIIACGGVPKLSNLNWLKELGHAIVSPVPSLFTFNMPEENITELMGIVVNPAYARLQGTKLEATGPLLITHWGMSGPAILKLSAFGARILNDVDYKFQVQINWVNETNNDKVKEALLEIISEHPKKQIQNYRPFALPERLWHYLIDKASLPKAKPWSELGKTGLNKITTLLSNDVYVANGKTTFKEEFVTCGGVSLDSIIFPSMQSKVHPDIYFTGEVMDIDGITGGYNFQAAWTTAFLAGKLASQ